MEIKTGSSAINMPGEQPKKSKLESALAFMELASKGVDIAKGIQGSITSVQPKGVTGVWT
jgi:hypothetical protein